MQEEYDALLQNQTWTLVPLSPDANIVSGKWIFRQKINSDGSLARHKARWVIRGFTQQPGIEFDETFSHVIKPTTIHVVLSLSLCLEIGLFINSTSKTLYFTVISP
jgi:hypothetical protein